MDVRQYLSLKNFTWNEKQRPVGLVAIMNCPFCDDKENKFAISLVDGAFNCLHENKCGVKGSWFDFQKNLGDKPIELDNQLMFKKQVKVKTYKKPDIKYTDLSAMNKFLESRCISKSTAQFFKLCETPNHKALIFPYIKNKLLVGAKYRTPDKNIWKEPNCEPTLYNIDNCSGEMLIATEGEMDCLALKEYGFDSVSIPSGTNDLTWIEHEWEWLRQFKNIYLIMDYDKAGRKAVDQISTRLGKWRCFNVILPYKDVNECLMQGVKTSVILNCIDNAKPCRIKELCSAGEFEDEIIDLVNDSSKLYGTKTLFKGLNTILKGWRSGELTVWTGRNHSGKSTLLNQVILDLSAKRIKSCIASLEMPPARYLKWMLTQARPGKFLDEKTIKETLKVLDNFVYIVNTVDTIPIDPLLNIWEYAARRHGVKHFILDSLMRVEINFKDELNEQKEICNKLLSFAKRHEGHVHLVAHPRKSQSDSDKPDKVDIQGSGNITNLAHNVLAMWRTPLESNHNDFSAILFVKKNREWGEEGKVFLDFDVNSKLFSEVDFE